MEINNVMSQINSFGKNDKAKEAKSAVESAIAKSDNMDTKAAMEAALAKSANTDTLGAPVKNESVTYGKPTQKTKYSAVVEEAIQMSDERYASLKQLVKELVEKQGGTFTDISDAKNVKFADKETIDAAKASIAEGGDLGVDKLSDTIVGFAKNLAASDPAKAAMLKNAFVDGFKAAEGAWGGKLPDISYKTYDAVMAKFDAWENPTTETEDDAPQVATGE